ncbi:MAG TPA: hypothetical protein VGM17_02665 [Rhizomicrobium sp.]|jgi:hypothetical protein
MILRAIFWIAVVAVLMPHEPDLGLGRPGKNESIASQVSTALRAPHTCDGGQVACVALSAIVDRIKASGAKSLAQVKADIEEAEAQRREDSVSKD